LVEGDRRMFNQYGVILVNPDKHPNVKKVLGQKFIDYLISPAGQEDIANYKIDGQPLFHPNANEAASTRELSPSLNLARAPGPMQPARGTSTYTSTGSPALFVNLRRAGFSPGCPRPRA